MVHGLLVAVLEGGRCDCPGLMLVAMSEVRVLSETSLLAGLIGMAVVEAFVPRCILTWWQAQMEMEAAVVMLVLGGDGSGEGL